jgi:lysozyme
VDVGYAPDYGSGYAPEYGYDHGDYDKGHDKGYQKDFGKGYDQGYGYDGGQAACSYTVQPGDTLAWVSQSLGVSQYDLIVANGIANPDLIYVGQVLSNPSCGAGGYGLGAAPAGSYAAEPAYVAADYATGAYTEYPAADYAEPAYAADYAAADYASYDVAAAGNEYGLPAALGEQPAGEMYADFPAGDYAVSGFTAAPDVAAGYGGQEYPDAAAYYGPDEMVAALPATGGTYTVVAGDNLSQIAARNGQSVDLLLQVNGIQNPNIIYVGQQLIIP